MKTLASLHQSHKDVVLPYGKIISLAKAGKLAGVGEYQLGIGWPVTDEKSALKAITKQG